MIEFERQGINMSKVLKEKIIRIKQLKDNIYKMTIGSEYIAGNAKPGQFVNVKCCECSDILLRRPISICGVDRKENTFDIVFEIKGKGTSRLAVKTAGCNIDIIGPLGTPFDLSGRLHRIAVVGGGIGIFPLLFALNESSAATRDSFMGFRTADLIAMKESFERNSTNCTVSTDDGSFGYHGFITEIFERAAKISKYDIVYTCGPEPMMKRVAEICSANNIKFQVSLEQRMACGIGACLVCACKAKSENGWDYKRVCKDGPVFWSDEVIWEK